MKTLLYLLAAGLALGQSPSFEVALIKPAPPGAVNNCIPQVGGPGSSSPEQMSACAISLKALILLSYQVQRDRVVM